MRLRQAASDSHMHSWVPISKQMFSLQMMCQHMSFAGGSYHCKRCKVADCSIYIPQSPWQVMNDKLRMRKWWLPWGLVRSTACPEANGPARLLSPSLDDDSAVKNSARKMKASTAQPAAEGFLDRFCMFLCAVFGHLIDREMLAGACSQV